MIYKRAIYKDVVKRIHEKRNKLQVMVGPRQVGKTTLMGQVLEICDIPYESYSADDIPGVSADWLAKVWEAQRMKMLTHKEKERLLVIDEVQKITNWSETVKAEWDRDTREKRQLKVILLGSSRMLIKKGLTESLMGRFELIRLSHWTYSEMRDCFGWSLPQYIYYGGYPGAVDFSDDLVRWRNYVRDSIVEPSISKDALMDTQILKPQLLRQLFEIGSTYSGKELSLTKVAGQLQEVGNVSTLAAYLQLLDECGLLCGLQKFAQDKARKYNSVPKFQVHNSALRSAYMEESFEEVMENPDLWGHFVESAVGAYLVSRAPIHDYKVYYWRERNQEVDFILVRRNKKVALEVKSGRRKTNTGLPLFTERYKPHRALVVGSDGLTFEEFFTMDPEWLFH